MGMLLRTHSLIILSQRSPCAIWPTLAWECGFDISPESLYFRVIRKKGYPPKPGHFVKSGTCKEHYFGYLTTANCPAILDFKKYGFDGRRLKPYTKKELKEIISQFILI